MVATWVVKLVDVTVGMKADEMGSLSAASWVAQMAADWAARWVCLMVVRSAARLEEQKAETMVDHWVYLRAVH
jgi:hypothetical protein